MKVGCQLSFSLDVHLQPSVYNGNGKQMQVIEEEVEVKLTVKDLQAITSINKISNVKLLVDGFLL